MTTNHVAVIRELRAIEKALKTTQRKARHMSDTTVGHEGWRWDGKVAAYANVRSYLAVRIDRVRRLAKKAKAKR